jgi:ATP-dependent helicase HrpB
MALEPLPIDVYVPEIVARLRSHGALVLVAPPGAGKTTRVPVALVDEGPVVLLQPRRVAARALARRIADEQGWTLGEEVGWQVRFERRFSARTRLLVATEGVLSARLQSDPLLSDFRTVVLDEFHERSVHADLALALARQARLARGDLRLLVMSATLDAAPIARFLGDCPIIDVPGRAYPVEIEHAAGWTVAAAVKRVLPESEGHLLAFLPGSGEIRRAAGELIGIDAAVWPLHGSLQGDEQDAALAPSARRKVILATNLAETSLTVDGVRVVIDSGLHKVNRYDPSKGIDRLETERITQDSATQRAGRAGRTGPGRVLRLWDVRERLRPEREPEIGRVDLSGPFLDVIAWGGDPSTFEWFEAPRAEAAEAALTLLSRLGALDAQRRLTPLGEQLRRLPVHPRLARVLLASGGSARAAAACALLSERLPLPSSVPAATTCDLLPLIDRMSSVAPGAQRVARELEALAQRVLREPDRSARDEGDERLRHALLLGFPDRLARRRRPQAPQLQLASGHGAVLARESGVLEAEYLVALEVSAGVLRGPATEALVRLASAVDAEWIEPTRFEHVHELDPSSGNVRATRRQFYDAIVLREAPTAVDAAESERLLLSELRSRGLGDVNEALLRRLRFAGVAVDLDALLTQACAGRRSLPQLDLAGLLSYEQQRELERHAPARLAVPSGRTAALEYREDGSVFAAVKLQELFGLAETPLLGRERTPVTFELLSPNGRPVQTTRDLKSFWDRTYPEVRKELRGRYPRHPWPDDPWTAIATHRAKPRPR